MALFPRSDRPETRVRLRSYFHRNQCIAETEQIGPIPAVGGNLSLASLGPVEGGDGIVEGRDVADVRPQSSVTHPLDDLTQLGAIGLDNEVDRQAVGGPRLGRADNGHEYSSGSNQACGPLLDVAADDIEHQILAIVFISCLLFGRETHASTTQSDPLLLPTRNGPYREDGALRWEYLF